MKEVQSTLILVAILMQSIDTLPPNVATLSASRRQIEHRHRNWTASLSRSVNTCTSLCTYVLSQTSIGVCNAYIRWFPQNIDVDV